MKNKETLEEVAERLYSDKEYPMYGEIRRDGFINGAKWQQERSYNEDDLEEAFKSGFTNCYNHNNTTFGEWFEQFKNK